MSLSSPNRMVWTVFRSLRSAVAAAAGASDEDERRDQAVLSIILGVTAVETFTNAYYRTLVGDPRFVSHRARVFNDLDPPDGARPRGLNHKLCKWAPEILGRSFKWQKGVACEFDELRKQRNSLMHFSASQGSVDLPGLQIVGLLDTSCYDELTNDDANRALALAEGMVEETLRLRGVNEADLAGHVHLWTGKPPGGLANTSMQADGPSGRR